MKSSLPLFLALISPASAQVLVQQSQTLAPSFSLRAEYGDEVDVDGDTAVVSASRGTHTLVYELVNGTWTQVEDFTSQTTPANSLLPAGIPAVSGDTLAISYGSLVGIDIFDRAGGVWTYTTTVVPPVPASPFGFGNAFALDGDTMVLGVPRMGQGSATDVGGAYVFQRSGGAWNSQGFLLPSNTSGGDFAGHEVAVDGDTVLLSAREDGGYSSGYSFGPGSVTVFVRNGSVWTQQQKLTASGGGGLLNFGRKIAIDGETLVASDANRGLRIFERASGSWSEIINLVPADAPPTLYVFDDVDISGDAVCAGLPTDSTLGTSKGACYLFHRDGGSWSQQAKVFPEQEASGFIRFGGSVAMDDERLLAGMGWDISSQFPRRVVAFDWRSGGYPTSCFGDGASMFPGCATCPCSNDAFAGARGGCLNSRQRSAQLGAVGSASLTNDTLQFDLVDASAATFAILFSGQNLLPQTGPCPPGTGLLSSVFTDGLRCVGGSVVRHGTRATTAGGQSSNPWGGASSASGLLASGSFAAGEVRHFQCFYRDTGNPGCLNGQNSTNAVTVTIAP